jgi:NADH dehydrogenase
MAFPDLREPVREMSVVVFGGSGFIGSHLVAELVAQGASVVVPTRRFETAKHLLTLPHVDVVEANVYDDATLRELVDGQTAAVNLVGVLHSRRGMPWGPEFQRAHVELPRKIVDACAARGVRRYLHMSALGADPNGPSMYQRSKAEGEVMARSHPEVAATIFRPSVVFGPEDKFLNTFARLQRRLPVVPLACADAVFQPVYVGDVAAAYIRALTDPKTRHLVFHLGGPQIYTLAELVRLPGLDSGHARNQAHSPRSGGAALPGPARGSIRPVPGPCRALTTTRETHADHRTRSDALANAGAGAQTRPDPRHR